MYLKLKCTIVKILLLVDATLSKQTYESIVYRLPQEENTFITETSVDESNQAHREKWK